MKTLKKCVSTMLLASVASFFTPNLDAAPRRCKEAISAIIIGTDIIIITGECVLVGESDTGCLYLCPNPIIIL